MGKNVKTTSESQRKMLNIIQALSLQHSKWRVWSDFVVSSACAISNVVDSVNRSDRERMYKAIMKKYAPDEAEKFHELQIGRASCRERAFRLV